MPSESAGFSIRHAVSADAGALVEFNRAMARETEGRELPLEIITAGVEAVLNNRRHGFYLVAERDGEIAGALMITMEWSDWRNGVFWWIQSVYVKPDFRRQGVYRRLYEFVKKQAVREGGVCGFRLYVERDNHVAQQVYARLGMKETRYKVYEDMIPAGSAGSQQQ